MSSLPAGILTRVTSVSLSSAFFVYFLFKGIYLYLYPLLFFIDLTKNYSIILCTFLNSISTYTIYELVKE